MGERSRLGGLAAPDKGPRIDFLEFLANGGGDGRAGALCQRLELFERVIGMDTAVAVKLDADQNGPLVIIGVGIIRQVQSVLLGYSQLSRS